MIVHNVKQGSEEWERLRKGKLTVSEFGRIVTPAKLQLASGAKTYAIQKVAEMLGVESPSPAPTFYMERGTELEPYALSEFESTVAPVNRVGFIEFDGAAIGGSPDGLVGDDAVLEIKCPKAETLIEWHCDGVLPSDYRMQCQGMLWLTGRKLCHFWGWHPEIEPFHVTVVPEPEVLEALDKCIPKVLDMMADILKKVKVRKSSMIGTEYQMEDVSL
jgi:hypothetical protein